MKSIHGLTLIEMMTALTLLAIMATVAIPSYQYLVTHNKIVTDTNRLLGSLLYARSEAAKRGESVTACPTVDFTASPPICGGTGGKWSPGWIVFEDAGKDGGFTDGDDTVLRREAAVSGGNTIKAANFDDYIRYDPDGRSNSSGNFTFCSEDNEAKYTREVDVAPTGRPRVAMEGSCP
jgi:type IV fimbrial biogenesis protein FimT